MILLLMHPHTLSVQVRIKLGSLTKHRFLFCSNQKILLTSATLLTSQDTELLCRNGAISWLIAKLEIHCFSADGLQTFLFEYLYQETEKRAENLVLSF